MSGADEGQEKTEDATPRRIEKAREEGDIPRSTDVLAAAAYSGLALAMLITISSSAGHLAAALRPLLDDPHRLSRAMLGPGGGKTSLDLFANVAAAVFPVLALPAAVVVLALVAQRAIVVAPSKIRPKLSHISILSNAKQKYGPQGLVEFLKSAIKMVAVGAVLYFALSAEFDRIGGYAALDGRALPQLLETQVWNVLGGVLVISIVIAAIDLIWQRMHHLGRLRMSHQEVRDEMKQSEGDPHMRQSRRQRARDIATNRMMLDVPTADVVVVNPSHYAVALKWQRGSARPPICVAKGVDEVARRIREVAGEAGVPLHSDPSAARSMFALVEIGREIRTEHFRAAAAAIVFADQVRAKAEGRAVQGSQP